ncbi:MAG: hypothetical protein ACSLE6_02965 [Mycobacterium sp.]
MAWVGEDSAVGLSDALSAGCGGASR